MDDKRPLDLALDLLVYAPVGLAVSARELLPKLAERGRVRLSGQVTTARVVGQLAVRQGQVQGRKAFARARADAVERLEGLGSAPAAPTTPVRAATPAARTATSSAAAESLAIPGYDSLSASQVLPRLDGLAASELEAVRTYEAAHRGRKTILGRISQLQSAS